jgi:sulfite exporter TauE/SafE
MLPLAATSGNAAEGALILAAFGAGTLPALVAVGGAGLGVARVREKAWVRRVAGTAIIGLAVFGLIHLPAATDLAALAWLCLSPRV